MDGVEIETERRGRRGREESAAIIGSSINGPPLLLLPPIPFQTSCSPLPIRTQGMADTRHEDVEAVGGEHGTQRPVAAAPPRLPEEGRGTNALDTTQDVSAGEKALSDGTGSSSTRAADVSNLAALTDPTQKRRIEENAVLRRLQRVAEKLSHYNIEGIGIAPITREQRTNRQWWSPGLLWFSANVNGACTAVCGDLSWD